MKKLKDFKFTKKNIIIISICVILILAVVITLIILNKKETPKVEEAEQQEEVIETKKLTIFDQDSKSRPYAIMINNHPTARLYHAGLQDAYIIYEIVVEGGITRYLALFLDQQTAKIGSVRSSRHYFIDYALENDAIYVHHGYSPQAAADFPLLGNDRIEVNDKSGWRDSSLGIAYEHTLFTNIEKLNSVSTNKRQETNKDRLLNYSVDEIDLSTKEEAKEAKTVTIKYSNAVTDKYVYDEENKYYLMSVNGKEHTDSITKQQYHFKNIITYQVENYTLDDPENKGRQGLNNVGEGEGYFITNGYAIKIKWSKASRESQTKYTYLNGEEIDISDGNTMINIQPLKQTLTIE